MNENLPGFRSSRSFAGIYIAADPLIHRKYPRQEIRPVTNYLYFSNAYGWLSTICSHLARAMGDKSLSSELFQKISRSAVFFIFAGKGFESQWLCQNMLL